jgi:hypothetical protein
MVRPCRRWTQGGVVRRREQYVDEDGKPAMRPTPRAVQMGRSLAMAGDDADADAVLDALLDAEE